VDRLPGGLAADLAFQVRVSRRRGGGGSENLTVKVQVINEGKQEGGKEIK
jgi:hypothetical protein